MSSLERVDIGPILVDVLILSHSDASGLAFRV
jgi:hypothetical protein